MCGIAGLWGNASIDFQHIKTMTDVINHRGPDSDGHKGLFDNRLWLGHRRLSILDLTDVGKQPMEYDDGRFWITYNGEIYNYLELRSELEKIGYRFRSNTDTEVILASYAEWGKGCLHKFNGMWAFIIVDTKQQTLFAARDRFGVKPLYYWRSPQGLWAFASEIKQFTRLPGWKARMNGQRAYDFLNWGIVDHTNETLFEGVLQIRGGHAIECNLIDAYKTRLNEFQWYELKPRSFCSDIMNAAEEFRELFTDSVRLRLRSDVPVGSCLSGGLDSSSIVCVVNDLLKSNDKHGLQKTVSACATLKQFDEREYIEEVVCSRDLEAYFCYPQLDDFPANLENIIWHQDEPFGSTSIFAQWCVFDLAAKKGLKVMLDGQGADEQLAGYHSFFAPRFTGLLKQFSLLSLFQEIYSCKQKHNYDIMFAIKGIADMLLPDKLRDVARKRFGKNSCDPNWLDVNKLGAVPVDPFVALGAKTSTIQEMSYCQLTSSNLQMLLHWEDRDSMAHSVETRLPFLDYRLVEFVLGLPDDMKLARGVTKRVLRQAMKDILPHKINCRMDKMGFVTPERVWNKENVNYLDQQILNVAANSGGIFRVANNGSTASSMIARNIPVWRIVTFGEWLKLFNIT